MKPHLRVWACWHCQPTFKASFAAPGQGGSTAAAMAGVHEQGKVNTFYKTI